MNIITSIFAVSNINISSSNQEMSNTMTINEQFAMIDAGTDADYSITITFEAGECEPETVTVNNVVYTITHMTNVDVSFSGRVHRSFTDVEGYLFQGTDGTSDFLLRVQAPLCIWNAKQWMSRNEDMKFNTKVVVSSSK
jgi:hypothetical protein